MVTPRPWEILVSKPLNTIAIAAKSRFSIPFAVLKFDGVPESREDNAHHIVKCVNAHEELVRALKVAKALLERTEQPQGRSVIEEMSIIREALRLAE